MPTPFIGQIQYFAGNFAPRGWSLCNGQLLAISSNTALFSILGTTYGGDGRTTFALPDLRGRLAMHAGTGPGLSPRPLGQRSGTETNTLNVTQLASHNHIAVVSGSVRIPVSGANGDDGAADGAFLATPSGNINIYKDAATGGEFLGNGLDLSQFTTTIQNNGGNQAINNLMPYEVVNSIIALVGTYPSRS